MSLEQPFLCIRCKRDCDLRYEYALELESGTYAIQWYRCPSCRGEYLHSPELLKGEEAPLEEGAGVGPVRRVALCHVTTVRDSEDLGGGTLAPLLAAALSEDFVDAALLPDYGVEGAMGIISDPEEAIRLHRTWSSRARSFAVNAGLPANFDFLLNLEKFARTDRGEHPRIAVAGRPCHVYAGRHANFDKFAPGYTVDLSIGLFCYGNVSPAGSPALRFEKVTGLTPQEIRGMTAVGNVVRVEGADHHVVEVPLEEFSSFLHRSCLKCVDFTVPWADLSLGESPQVEGFDVVLTRSPTGDRLFEAALRTGRLRAWSPPWMAEGGDSLRILNDLTAVKRELTQIVR